MKIQYWKKYSNKYGDVDFFELSKKTAWAQLKNLMVNML